MELKEVELAFPPQTSAPTKSPSGKKNHWSLLRNVLKAVTLLRNHEANAPLIDDLLTEIKQIPTDQAYKTQRNLDKERSEYAVAVKDIRREQTLFNCVEKGSPEDLDLLRKLIDEDPYRFLTSPGSPDSLLNKKNRSECTPLYVACKHGNLNVVRFLLEKGADHTILSLEDQESSLLVAVRWGHTNIVKELLCKKWNKQEIKKALKAANKNMKSLINSKVSTKRCCWCL